MVARDEFSSNEITTQEAKPLGRVQRYLVELRVCTGLVRDLLLEIKELVVIVSYILIFILGVIHLLNGLNK
jgi:hypothetical protein